MKLDAPGQVEAPLPGSGDVNCELDAWHGLRCRSNGSATAADAYHGAARLRKDVKRPTRGEAILRWRARTEEGLRAPGATDARKSSPLPRRSARAAGRGRFMAMALLEPDRITATDRATACHVGIDTDVDLVMLGRRAQDTRIFR